MKSLIENFKKIFLSAAFGLLFVFSGYAQNDFKKIFGSDYTDAEDFLKKEKWMVDRIREFKLQPREVFAVIFPELIRYRSIQDKIEIFALKSLYTQYGTAYANFSVGRFQLKPSFAEQLEKDFLKIPDHPQIRFDAKDTINNEDSRSRRLKRLEDNKAMVDYLCCFFIVMEKLHPKWKNDEDKIKFLSAAYNCGYEKSDEEIRSFITKKFFHTGIAAFSRYAYAD